MPVILSQRDYLVVGAGFSGAVLARELAGQLDGRVTVLESRPHVAGNCHTARDPATGILLHEYGPHIFNTNRQHVWDYVNRFGTLRPYTNRVKASTSRGIFSFPINLHTINQFFGKRLDPDGARAFLASLGDKRIGEPRNFEEQALKLVGRELYETFFHGYTRKQWGCEPRELPASILQRLPIRFNYDDNYYKTSLQGVPEHGYTPIVERILDHPRITVRLGESFTREMGRDYAHTFYSGPLDAFFDYELGRLGYRTVTFERIAYNGADYQGNAVINYPELEPAYTRIHEHKHFAPWEQHAATVAFREFSRETGPDDVPYYPKRLAADRERLLAYRRAAAKVPGVTLFGRLGTYRYLDMEAVIDEALALAAAFVASRRSGAEPSRFPNEEGPA
ncbi:MAG: UDP-galactopyranose mutase [Verrucomicrobiota bacterium]